MKLSERIRNSLSDDAPFSFPIDEWADEVAQLEADNQRLREAGKRLLNEIHRDDIDDGHYFFSVGMTTWKEFLDTLKEGG